VLRLQFCPHIVKGPKQELVHLVVLAFIFA
jgi:hypothetical protein